MIVAGFGFRAAADIASLKDAYGRARAALPEGVAPESIATVSDKAEMPVFRALAAELALDPIGVDAARLADQKTSTRSEASIAARGASSVAEAAALAAAGPGARLLGPRVVSGDGMATCALAEGDTE
ncbi:precorrin methylase [Alphaproteobacteria bacterium GH1-50]|uniref:Precorrin methylase n=1 Tax=Kangsaoukella pontilimi TaxID=2691042 RepID=A0A7C9MXH2_9RHOB|nr:cobalamin biosynthesis protein [Kangsaoukella pontilimi]MXQ09060.1 precorrin methylase [Kangsaoukella pontilimi]